MPNGWEKLGAALAGVSDGSREDIRIKTMNALATRDSNIERAKQAIMKTRGLEGADDSLSAIFGVDADMGRAYGDYYRGGGNLNEVTNARGNLQEQGYQSAARDAALAGNYGDANANIFGVTKTPQALPMSTPSGVIANRFVEPTLSDIMVTPRVQSEINRNAASARAFDARATKSLTPAGAKSSGRNMSETDKAKMQYKLNSLKADRGALISQRAAFEPTDADYARLTKEIAALDAAAESVIAGFEGAPDVSIKVEGGWDNDGNDDDGDGEDADDAPYSLGADLTPDQIATARMLEGQNPRTQAADFSNARSETKVVGGKTYYKRNGKWYAE